MALLATRWRAGSGSWPLLCLGGTRVGLRLAGRKTRTWRARSFQTPVEPTRQPFIHARGDDIALLRLDKYVQQVQDKVHQWPEKGKAGQYKKLPNKRGAAAAGSKRKRGAVCHPAHPPPPPPRAAAAAGCARAAAPPPPPLPPQRAPRARPRCVSPCRAGRRRVALWPWRQAGARARSAQARATEHGAHRARTEEHPYESASAMRVGRRATWQYGESTVRVSRYKRQSEKDDSLPTLERAVRTALSTLRSERRACLRLSTQSSQSLTSHTLTPPTRHTSHSLSTDRTLSTQSHTDTAQITVSGHRTLTGLSSHRQRSRSV